jgi:hypothetical protein
MRRSGLFLILISAIFIIFVFYSLLHLEPLEVSGGRLQHLGASVVVVGSVINHGSRPQSAGLKVQFYDGAGRKLAVQELDLGRLAPGQRMAFTSRPVAAQAQTFTIQVDRGSNMYGN